MKITILITALLTRSTTMNSLSIDEVILGKLTFPSTVKAGNPRQVWHCRKAVKGCAARLKAFDGYFHDATAGKEYANDPWLLAAMAFKETGMNPFAVGDVGEMGLLQVHPKHRRAKGLKFHRSVKYREACRKKVGACQAEIVTTAVEILDSSIEKCGGDVAKGLGMYNSGHCNDELYYSRKVLKIRDELLARSSQPTEEAPG